MKISWKETMNRWKVLLHQIPWKEMLTSWRVLLLLSFIIFSLIVIKPQLWGAEGLSIRAIALNSSAAQAGMENPAPHSTPLAKERLLSINKQPVSSLEEYASLTQQLLPNQTVTLETSRGRYMLQTVAGNGSSDLGLRLASAPTSNIRKGLDLEGGTRVLLQPTAPVSEEDLELTVESLKERLNVYGLSDIVVRSAADLAGNDFILVEIAGVTAEEVKELLAKQGKFEAKIGNETVFFGGKNDITYVCRSADCSGIDPQTGCGRLADGYACGFFFGITLSPEAAERQGRLTQQLSVVDGSLSEPLVLFLDDAEVDRLQISSSLKGVPATQIQITGSGTGRVEQEAVNAALQNMKRLQTILITGSLPIKIEIVKIDTISPSLGKEFLENVVLIAFLALAAVIAVVFLRYRRLRIALPMSAILLSEVVMVLGFAALVGWNLDLAAIAGIIIATGTGVDHLIIITDETVGRQQQAASSWKQRLKNAMFIVMGSYLTVLAGMLPLWFAGAGLLKGFAFTTIVGLSFGVLIARPAYAVIIEKLLRE